MKIRIHSGKSAESGNNSGHTNDVTLHSLEDYLDRDIQYTRIKSITFFTDSKRNSSVWNHTK